MPPSSLISIVLPTYNRAKVLYQAINSVLSQTFKDWELIIWDDGSTDNTKEVVLSYQNIRIKYYYEPNIGKPYALNQAIAHAKGEFIAFLDDDDQWLPNKLEQQINKFVDYPEIDLILTNFKNLEIQSHREGFGFTQNASGIKTLETKELDKTCFIIIDGWLKGISRANFIAFDSVIMKKNVIDQMGVFNENLKASEDFEYWWRFGLAGFQAAYLDQVLLNRVKSPGSLSGMSVRTLENQLKMLDTCRMFSIKYNQPETIAYLRPMYRNAWQNLISARAQAGDRQGMIAAFWKSIHFGFRPGALRLLLRGLITVSKGTGGKSR